MICAIKSRAHKVIHTCIHYDKLFTGTALDVGGTCNERAALGNYAATKFKMHLLPREEFKMLCVGIELEGEIGNIVLVGSIVTDAQTTAYIYMRKHQPASFVQHCLQFVHSAA